MAQKTLKLKATQEKMLTTIFNYRKLEYRKRWGAYSDRDNNALSQLIQMGLVEVQEIKTSDSSSGEKFYVATDAGKAYIEPIIEVNRKIAAEEKVRQEQEFENKVGKLCMLRDFWFTWQEGITTPVGVFIQLHFSSDLEVTFFLSEKETSFIPSSKYCSLALRDGNVSLSIRPTTLTTPEQIADFQKHLTFALELKSEIEVHAGA